MSLRDQTFRIAVRDFEPFERAIRAQWRAFEATRATGLALETVKMDLKSLESSLFHADGMREGHWDIGFVSTDWIALMHLQQAALDLAPLLAKDSPDDYPYGWPHSLLQLQRVGDKVLGIPYHNGPECLVYRKDLFDDEQLRSEYQSRYSEELAPPCTWAEFQRIARFLQRPDRGLFGTVFAAFPDAHNTVYDFLLQLWSRGGELIDSTGQIRFETSLAFESLTFYRAILGDTNAVHPQCALMDSISAGKAFASGEAAMMVNWFGFATEAHMIQNPASLLRVGIAPVPHGDDGKSVSLNVYWLLAIAAGTPHPALAWKFIKHVMKADMDRLTTLSGGIGCRRSTWHDPAVNGAIPFYSELERLHEHARQIPQRADWPAIAAIIDELMTATMMTNRPIAELLRQAEARLSSRPH